MSPGYYMHFTGNHLVVHYGDHYDMWGFNEKWTTWFYYADVTWSNYDKIGEL